MKNIFLMELLFAGESSYVEEEKRTHEENQGLLYSVRTVSETRCEDVVQDTDRHENEECSQHAVRSSVSVLPGGQDNCQEESLHDARENKYLDDRRGQPG